MEQWDAVIMGNDELLEKYMSGKPFKMSELEQEEKQEIPKRNVISRLSRKR